MPYVFINTLVYFLLLFECFIAFSPLYPRRYLWFPAPTQHFVIQLVPAPGIALHRMGYPLRQGKWETQNGLLALPHLASAPRPPATKGEFQPRSLSPTAGLSTPAHMCDPRDTKGNSFTYTSWNSRQPNQQTQYKIILKAMKTPFLQTTCTTFKPNKL